MYVKSAWKGAHYIYMYVNKWGREGEHVGGGNGLEFTDHTRISAAAAKGLAFELFSTARASWVLLKARPLSCDVV